VRRTLRRPRYRADAAAAVGAKPLSYATVEHWIDIARLSGTEGHGKAPRTAAVIEQVMQFLVGAEWVHGETALRGIAFTPAQVNARFEKTRRQNFQTSKDFDKFLAESGMTIDDLLYRVELDMLSNALRANVTKDVRKPTNAQASAFYVAHKRSFRRPRLHEAVIVERRTRQAAQRALDAVRAGRSWRSQKAVRRAAEDLPLPRLAWHIRHAARGVPAGPVKSQGHFFVFELRHIRPTRQRTFAQSRAEILSQLHAAAQQRELDAFVRGFQSHWKAETVCRRGYSTQDCGTIVD
jgi:foldase protein PrsA